MHIVLDGPDPEASGLSTYLTDICKQRFGKRMHPWSLERLLNEDASEPSARRLGRPGGVQRDRVLFTRPCL